MVVFDAIVTIYDNNGLYKTWAQILTADISPELSKTKYLFDISHWGVAGKPVSFSA